MRDLSSEAVAILIDATACGRSVTKTICNMEERGGRVSNSVKVELGALRSTITTAPPPTEEVASRN